MDNITAKRKPATNGLERICDNTIKIVAGSSSIKPLLAT
jgi:hypothetical protein